jgi:hypothetical protein
MSFAPSEQFNPIDNGLKCDNEFKNASTVCPDNVRPLASTIVPEIITGISISFSSKPHQWQSMQLSR